MRPYAYVNYQQGYLMQHKLGVLLAAVLMTSSAIADDTRYNSFGTQNSWQSPMMGDSYSDQTENGARQEDGTQGPSKAEIIEFLGKKLARSIEKTSLLEQEISCVQRANDDNDSLSRCYEIARQKRQYYKQKHGLNRANQRRNRQGAGVMPGFDRMGMGMMPTPW